MKVHFTREEKFALWDAAYARWEPARAAPKAEKDAVFDWALTRWEAARAKKMGIDL